MDGFALWKFRRLVLRRSVLLLIMTRSAMPQSTPAVQQLINELPACSVLHAELERGTYGGGIDQSYMGRMRQQGVQRALIELRAVLRGGKPDDIHVERRLYFRHFDGPMSQISDQATLKMIEASSLPADLDGVARSRVLAAPISRGVDMQFRPIKQVSTFVEFFANAWLPEQNVVWFRSGKPKQLTGPVLNGDVLGTKALLGSHRFDKTELDRGLFIAVLSRYDNTDVIKLLLDAGAEVNARAPDGSTPLMSAVARPCNLRPLLDGGADVNARDKIGQECSSGCSRLEGSYCSPFVRRGGCGNWGTEPILSFQVSEERSFVKNPVS